METSRRKRKAFRTNKAGSSSAKRLGARRSKNVEDNFMVNEDAPCKACGLDTNHAQLLICDKCDDPFHTYCLTPALDKIPEGDWYCESCKPNIKDGLEELVEALPSEVKVRFGDICWAELKGYGWWPCTIFDPRLTMGEPRARARKHLGKKFLVYYLECDETPFDLLTPNKIIDWQDGLDQGFHLHKPVPLKGTNRYWYRKFQIALNYSPVPLETETPEDEAAILLSSLDADETEGNNKTNETTESVVKKRRRSDVGKAQHKKRYKLKDTASRDGEVSVSSTEGCGAGKDKNLTKAFKVILKSNLTTPHVISSSLGRHSTSHNEKKEDWSDDPTESDDDSLEEKNVAAKSKKSEKHSDADGELYCRVFVSTDLKPEGVCVGFVELPSRKHSTFEDARKMIDDTLEPDLLFHDWRFYHPKLGPVSLKMERKIGSLLAYLNKGSQGAAGRPDGTIDDPVQVTIIESLDPLSRKRQQPVII